MPTRKASATWEGGIKSGKGSFKGESGAIGGAYSFGSRFESEKGSNPEELLAAAEAACFSMALSGWLERNGTPATRIDTDAACTVEPDTEGFKISTIKLDLRVSAPGLDDAKFQEIAVATKNSCPVSKAFAGNVDIQLDAKLV